MNKEEVLNTFLLANIPEIITQEEFDDVKKAIKELQQENKQLKDVIEEAIEYIRNHRLVFKDTTLEETEEWFNQFYIDVLDILKEVE